MFDFILLAVWGLVLWCVAGEGAFGAGVTCIVVIISGLAAMNFFEPLASFCQSYLAGTGAWAYRWDMIALIGLFAAFVLGLRMGFEKLSPRYVPTQGLLGEIARWLFGAITGYVVMAFLLTAVHTAPLPREFMGFKPERRNLFDVVAPDRQWLGFTQYVSETLLARGYVQAFDAPTADFIDDPNNEARNTVWPSFPIRYAHRREIFSGGGMPDRPVVQPQPQQQRPSSAGAAGF